MAINRGKLAALVMGGLALLWIAALFFGLPFLYSKKIDALVGQDAARVETELGVPKRQWGASAFECDPAFPCKGPPAGGPVYLYNDSDKKQAWYLYFDASGTLQRLEAVGIPGPEATLPSSSKR